MKIKKGEMIRAYSLIENDRLSAKDDFIEMLKKDLLVLLSDYFEFNGELKTNIEKKDGKNELIVHLKFERIKSFGILRKQVKY